MGDGGNLIERAGVGGEGAPGNLIDRVGDDAWRNRSADDVMSIAGGAESLPEIDTLSFPGPVAQACYWDDSDIVGIVGPVGSGKTDTILRSRLRRARMAPRSVIDGVRRYKLLIVRETYRQLWSTTIPSYLGVYPKTHGVWSGGRGDPVTHRLGAKVPGEDRYVITDEFGEIEMTVEFMAFGDDIIAAMRGTQFTDIYANELDTMPQDVLTVGTGRIGRYPGAAHFRGYADDQRNWAQVICDFNAPDESNWVYDLFYNPENTQSFASALSATEGPSSGVRISFHRQPGYGEAGCENLQNLGPGYYDRQIALNKAAGRGDMNDRMVFNRTTYLRIGDPVFKREWRRSIHVSQEPLHPEPRARLRIGLDQGFLGAAVIATFRPPFIWRIHAELMFPKDRLMADVFGDRLAALLSERFPDHDVEAAWGDMAGEHGASQATDETATWNKIVGDLIGTRVRPQKIGANRIQPRLEAVRAGLEYLEGGEPGILIDPSCRFLISAFEARYIWTDAIDSTGDKRKTPDKSIVEANVMDALQYLMLSEMRTDGRSPISGPRGAHGRGGRSTATGGHRPAGLRIGHDVLNPYGAPR